MPLQGGCNCGAVQITVQDLPYGQPFENVYCHCSTCKRQSGASGAYEIIADEKLVQIDDPNTVRKTWKDYKTASGNPTTRSFCGECGCPLFTTTPIIPNKFVVKMGLFDHIPQVTVEMFTKNKQSWEPTVEGAKVYQAGR